MRPLLLLLVAFQSIAAEPAFEFAELGIDLGHAAATEEQTRSLASIVFTRLKAKLGDNAIKGLIVNDNLNHPSVVGDEAQRFAGNAPFAVVSVKWQETPGFAVERVKTVPRGIYAAALVGDAEARFVHAHFLKATAETEDESVDEAAAAVRGPAEEFIRAQGLLEARARNIFAVIPANHVASSRFYSMGRAHSSLITAVPTEEETQPHEIIVNVNGLARTNAPLGILLISDAKFLKGVTPFSKPLHFHENWFASTHATLTDLGVRILESAKEVETFRLYSGFNRPTTGDRFEDRIISKVGLATSVGRVVANEILVPLKPRTALSMCGFDPGLGFRFNDKQGTVNLLVCLTCGEIAWTVRDPAGKQLSTGRLYIDAPTRHRLASAGLTGLPGDAALERVKDN